MLYILFYVYILPKSENIVNNLRIELEECNIEVAKFILDKFYI